MRRGTHPRLEDEEVVMRIWSRARGAFDRRTSGVAAVVAALAVAAATVGPAPSVASIPASAFPSKAVVKSVLDGKGHWRVSPGDLEKLGAKPRGCRSDKQMLAYDDARVRWYAGREVGMPRSVFTSAEIAVLTYADDAAARAAVQRNASYPRRCPKVVEWVCTDCDGIDTTWRTRTPAARVGDQSVAWRFRQFGNLKSNGWAVVARDGATVVRVRTLRTRDVFAGGRHGYPRLMDKKVAVRLARTALSTATSATT